MRRRHRSVVALWISIGLLLLLANAGVVVPVEAAGSAQWQPQQHDDVIVNEIVTHHFALKVRASAEAGLDPERDPFEGAGEVGSEDVRELQSSIPRNVTTKSSSNDTDEDEKATSQPSTQVSVWTPVSITQETIRIALDAVRYRNNYEKYITTRLCLHRINLIRNRQVDDLESYLFSVDGCESAKITLTGRCDIYYCKLATYEVKVTQKTANKEVYIVQSIFKTLTQKPTSELMQPSNLDFKDQHDDDSGSGDAHESAVYKVQVGSEISISTATAATRSDDVVELHALTRVDPQRMRVDPQMLRVSASVPSSQTALGQPVVVAIPGLWVVVSGAALAVFTVALAATLMYRRHHQHHHHRTRLARRDSRHRFRRRRRRPEQIHPPQPPPSSLSESSGLLLVTADHDDAV